MKLNHCGEPTISSDKRNSKKKSTDFQSSVTSFWNSGRRQTPIVHIIVWISHLRASLPKNFLKHTLISDLRRICVRLRHFVVCKRRICDELTEFRAENEWPLCWTDLLNWGGCFFCKLAIILIIDLLRFVTVYLKYSYYCQIWIFIDRASEKSSLQKWRKPICWIFQRCLLQICPSQLWSINCPLSMNDLHLKMNDAWKYTTLK